MSNAQAFEAACERNSKAICQNHGCKKLWKVALHQANRLVYLCPEDASYLLDLRKKNQQAANEFVASKCCNDEVVIS